jgi:hypothetical protein
MRTITLVAALIFAGWTVQHHMRAAYAADALTGTTWSDVNGSLDIRFMKDNRIVVQYEIEDDWNGKYALSGNHVTFTDGVYGEATIDGNKMYVTGVVIYADGTRSKRCVLPRPPSLGTP